MWVLFSRKKHSYKRTKARLVILLRILARLRQMELISQSPCFTIQINVLGTTQ